MRGSKVTNRDLDEIARRRLADNDPLVAISAAWLLTLTDAKDGQDHLYMWLNHSKQQVRLQAAGALIATGRHGLPLMQKAFVTTSDPYVKMTLALGLISQQSHVPAACQALNDGLQLPERWMWGQDGLFRYVAPSKERHRVTAFPTIRKLSTKWYVLRY